MEIEKLVMIPVMMSAKSHFEKPSKEEYPTFGEYIAQSLKKVNELELASKMRECQKFCVSPIASRVTTPFSKSLTQKNLHSRI